MMFMSFCPIAARLFDDMSVSSATLPLRLLIVDDEAPARARLRDVLGDIAQVVPHMIVGEAGDGVDALEFLAQPGREVDVVFVDIRMPRLDGIGLAQQLLARPQAPAVIFTTAYDQYAVRAFELNALDYLLKPVRATRLQAALQKLPQTASAAATAAALQRLAPEGRQHLSSSERGRILLVPLADILYLRAEQKYVTACTAEREYLLEESLTHLEEEFSLHFIRIHRNCLVARRALCGVERTVDADGQPGWQVLLQGRDERLPVSRRQWPLLKSLLKEET
jgi:two-component system response regulator AlgR